MHQFNVSFEFVIDKTLEAGRMWERGNAVWLRRQVYTCDRRFDCHRVK